VANFAEDASQDIGYTIRLFCGKIGLFFENIGPFSDFLFEIHCPSAGIWGSFVRILGSVAET